MDQTGIEKRTAAWEAVNYIGDGMVVGLGTGSTTRYAIERIAERIRKEELEIIGIPTSNATCELAQALNIPLSELNEHPVVDIDIDGADEFDSAFNLIKGGGGAHTREKIIAGASKKFIVVADSKKRVSYLGEKFAIPVEVMPIAEKFAICEIENLGAACTIRLKKNEECKKFITDNGNLIIDAEFNSKFEPEDMEMLLDSIPGVIECGIFARRRADIIIVGCGESFETLKRQ